MVNWDESPLESEVEKFFVNQIKKRGGTAYKFKSVNNRSVPDRVVTLYGFTHYVEIKREGATATDAQKKKHKTLRDAGGVVLVLAGHDEVRQYLATMDEVKSSLPVLPFQVCYLRELFLD